MFEEKQFLMIPGPTPVPEKALLALAKAPMPHRSKEFSEILLRCTHNLKEIAQTKVASPLIYAACGTGGMECTLVNVMNVGDPVLACVNGVFGKRWADMAESFGADVTRLNYAPGQAINVDQFKEALSQKKYRLVLVTFSETSTGVANPVQELAKIVREQSEALFCLDAITGLAAIPMMMDEWGVDVVISGSQKGFMIPPGLTFSWASEKALRFHGESKFPRFYWDWTKAFKALSQDTTAFTPNVSLVCALDQTLQMMVKEGMPKIWLRHKRLRETVRQSVKAMGLTLLAGDEDASAAITSVFPPEGVSVKDLRRKLKEDWQIVVADGQLELQGKIFRLGHLGYVSDRDGLMALSALAQVLEELGHKTGSEWLEVYKSTKAKYLQESELSAVSI